MLKKKINFNKVRKVVIGGRLTRLIKEAKNIEADIEDRTLSGKDVNLRSFKPYTAAYAKKKGSTRVNLNVKGHMLGAISSKTIKNGVRFFFNTGTETKKALGNQKHRKFFGVDRTQVKYLRKQLGKL